jgi:hypothetical protein
MEESNDPLCIIVVKSGAQGGKLLFKVASSLLVMDNVLVPFSCGSILSQIVEV